MRTFRYFIALSLFIAINAVIAAYVFVQPEHDTHNVTGYDISFPQCGGDFPEDPHFGVVGVNGGVPTKTNPCLSEQLMWAAGASGDGVGQNRIQLYVNTANPGHLDDPPGWPKDNRSPFGIPSPNPHGECNGKNTLACSWQYGWNRAMEAVHMRFAPAAREAGISDEPHLYKWWLDVETMNSWQYGSDKAYALNTASLEGMVDYMRSIDARIGMYSTAYQFGEIAGILSVRSNLNGLESWLAGGVDAENSKRMCDFPPLTPGGRVVMVQYIKDNFDHNYSCL